MVNMPLIRLMSGSDENAHVEEVWQDVFFKSTGPNGLIHTPLNGRPWGPATASPIETWTYGLCRDGSYELFLEINKGHSFKDLTQGLPDIDFKNDGAT